MVGIIDIKTYNRLKFRHLCDGADCDTCRWMAPNVFAQIDGQSAVFDQPKTETDRVKALQAMLTCPT
jgi:ferredoxin